MFINHTLPTYFLSHGGGPWPWMDGPFRRNFDTLERSLTEMREQLQDRPKAIVMISAHWETSGFRISSGAKPGMVYDYYGFPEQFYHIRYPAPGSPNLAEHAQGLIRNAGLSATLDDQRGFDHGTFSLMRVLYPEADMPVIQISIDVSMEPALHLSLGRALAPLRSEGILIVGSGLSYHNLRALGDPGSYKPSREFDTWLHSVLLHNTGQPRNEQLKRWESAPSARLAHPREDHLVPLMVAVGAAENESATEIYHESSFARGATVSSFRFGSL